MFFKNRAIQVQMVKTKKKNDPEQTPECNHFDPEKIHMLLKDQVKHLAVTVVAVAAAVTVLSTIKAIVVNNTNPQYR